MYFNTEHIERKVKLEIATQFYFLDYPEAVEEDFWKDGNGSYHHMIDLEKEHLKRCAKTIEKSLGDYNKQLKDVTHKPVKDILFPLAEKKLNEIKAEILRRV